MSMIYEIQQADFVTIQTLISEPHLIYQFLGRNGPLLLPPESGADSRLLERLQAFRKVSNPETFLESDAINCTGEKLHLGELWDGLHYMLVGNDKDCKMPNGFILSGGIEIGQYDLAYGPARAFTPDHTREINNVIEEIDVATLSARYNPIEMVSLSLYPLYGREPDLEFRNWLLEAFGSLKSFLARAAKRNCGMVAHLS